jgi:hypothetical protein
MGGACSTREMINSYKIMKGRENSEDLVVDG